MQENKQEKSLIKQNILTYLERKGVSQYQFYKETGVTRGILTQTNGISEDNISRFLAYAPDVNTDWLLTGKGEMLKKDTPAAPILPEPSPAGIPLIPIEAVAGFNGMDTPGITLEDCARYVIPEFKAAGADYLIRVSGSSMYPKYSSGDVLACHHVPEITFFQWGKIYVIDSAQGAMVKRIFECEEDPSCVLCKSDNEKYPPFRLPKSEIRSLSIVVGVIRLE